MLIVFIILKYLEGFYLVYKDDVSSKDPIIYKIYVLLDISNLPNAMLNFGYLIYSAIRNLCPTMVRDFYFSKSINCIISRHAYNLVKYKCNAKLFF